MDSLSDISSINQPIKTTYNRFEVILQEAVENMSNEKSHMKEMIRIHELWSESKRDLRLQKSEYENTVNELNEQVSKQRYEIERLAGMTYELSKKSQVELQSKNERIHLLEERNRQMEEINQKLQQEVINSRNELHVQIRHNNSQSERIRILDEEVNKMTVPPKLQTLIEDNKITNSQLNNIKQELDKKQQLYSNLEEKYNNLEMKWDNLEKKYNQIEQENITMATDANDTIVLRQYCNRLSTYIIEMDNAFNKITEVLSDSKGNKQSFSKTKIGKHLSEIIVDVMKMRQQLANHHHDHYQNMELSKHSMQLAKNDDMNSKQLHQSTRVTINNDESIQKSTIESDDIIEYLIMKLRHLPNGEELQSYVYKLNEVWKNKYKVRAKTLKRKYHKTLTNLKRKFNQSKPYENVVQLAQITRLKQNLLKLRKVYRQKKLVAPKDDRQMAKLLEFSLATVDGLTTQLERSEKKNHELMSQIIQTQIDENYLHSPILSPTPSVINDSCIDTLLIDLQNCQTKLNDQIINCLANVSKKFSPADTIPIVHDIKSAIVNEMVDPMRISIQKKRHSKQFKYEPLPNNSFHLTPPVSPIGQRMDLNRSV